MGRKQFDDANAGENMKWDLTEVLTIPRIESSFLSGRERE